MRWQAFLQRTLTASATAAAGGAATAVTANPVLGAAAGAAASKSAERLLGEFLPAQKEALDVLVERTRGMERLLGTVHSDVKAMIDRDWEAALLSIADAAKHPIRAQEELHVARRRLFDAWGGANSNAKRAQISQELSVVYGLLGERDDSREWLFRSYSESSEALAEAIGQTWKSIDELPRVKVRRSSGGPDDEVLAVHLVPVRFAKDLTLQDLREGWPSKFKGFVSAEPLISALDALAEAKAALVGLRFACAVAHMPVERLNEIVGWNFKVSVGSSWGLPGKSPRMFVSGSSPELGAWNEDLAVPLERVLYWQSDIHVWKHHLDAYDSDRSKSVQYKYFYVRKPSGTPIWEAGKPRRLRPAKLDRQGKMSRSPSLKYWRWKT